MARPAKNCWGISRETSTSFRIWFRPPGGESEFVTLQKTLFPTIHHVQAEASRRLMSALEGQSIKPTTKMTFDEIAQKVKAIKPKPSQECFQQMLNQFRVYWPGKIEDFKEFVILDYKQNAFEKGRGKETLNRDLIYLCQIGKAAVDYGLIKSFDKTKINYFSDDEILRDRPRKYYPTPDERRAFLKACKENYPEYFLWVSLAVSLGWRRGEIRNVKWRDINWEKGFVILRTTKRGHQERDFCTKGFDEVLEAFLMHKDLLKKKQLYSDDGLVYPSFRQGSKESGKNQLNGIVKKLCGIVEIKSHVTPHCFRFAVANELYQQGVPIEVIKRITGHTSLRTIQQYYSLVRPEDKKRAFEAIKL